MKTKFISRHRCNLLLVPALCLLAAGAALAAAGAPAANQNADVAKIVAELNQAAEHFRGAQADFLWDQYQAVVQESETQSGVIYFKRNHDATLMSVHIEKVDGQPVEKFLVYNGKDLRFYRPAIKQMTIFQPHTNRDQVESFLTLGFGGSGTDLEKNWTITPQGESTIDGVHVVQLDLKPKAAKVQSMFTHVTIWIDPVKGISLKQIFYEPSGDRRTVTYSHIQYNARVSDDVFRIKTAPGTTVQTQ